MGQQGVSYGHWAHQNTAYSAALLPILLLVLLLYCRCANQLQSLGNTLSKAHSDSSAILQRLAGQLQLPLGQKQSPPSSNSSGNAPAAEAVLAFLLAPIGASRAVASQAPTPFSQLVQHCKEIRTGAESSPKELQKLVDAVTESRAELAKLQVMENPYSAAVQQLERQLEAQQQDLQQRQDQQQELDAKVGWVWVVLSLCLGPVWASGA